MNSIAAVLWPKLSHDQITPQQIKATTNNFAIWYYKYSRFLGFKKKKNESIELNKKINIKNCMIDKPFWSIILILP